MLPELRIVPSTQWVGVRGIHPGALVEVRRATPTAVYFRIIRGGAGAGPRHHRGGPKNRLGRAEFLLNYRPNTKRDWQMATAAVLEDNHVTDQQEAVTDNGRLHADEEAIAQAIRDGARFHDVQRDYHVQGLVLSKIIDKYAVPYESTRDKRAAREQVRIQDLAEVFETTASLYPERDAEAEAEEHLAAQEAALEQPLHEHEDEIVEVMRTRAASYQEVLRTYRISPTNLAQIMTKHDIPRQTAEEKRAKHQAHYQKKRAQAQEALAATPEVAAPTTAPTPALEPEAVPAPAVVASGVHTWHVTVRVTAVQTYQASSFLEAALLATDANAGVVEIIGLVRQEPGA
jgi:hypothetical protein